MRWLVFTAVVGLSLAARAQDLDPAKAAQIEHDQQKEYDKIDEKHGNKAPNEMSSDERRDIIRERAEAEQKVFDKQGVDRRDYTRYNNTLGRDGLAAKKAASEKLAQKDEAEKKAKEAQKNDPNAPRDPKDIPIQRGFSDQNPVTLEEKKAGAGGIVVEHGLPPEAEADQAAAAAGNGPAESTSEKRPEEKKGKRPKH